MGRQGLIDATLALLRTTPPEELTLLDIATSVGVDPALIRYYFGNKNGLLRAATLHLMEFTQALGERLVQGTSIRALVRERISLIIDTGQQNPHFLKLVMREIYISDAPTGEPPRAFLESTAQRGVALSEAILAARPVTDGPLPQIDPRLLHVAMLGACTYFATAQPLFEVLFENEGDAHALAQRYIDFMTDFVLRGIGAS